MKKIFSIIAMATLMLSFAACTEKEDQPDQGGQNGNNTNATMLVGNWLVDQLTYNGQQLPMQDEMTIVMNANGTGEILENGQSHNNNFTWSVSENILTVTPGEESYTFTISGLTATECTLHGDVIPATDMRGDVVMHMTKQNGQPGPGPEPNPEDFPAGTAGGAIAGFIIGYVAVGFLAALVLATSILALLLERPITKLSTPVGVEVG